MKYVLSLSLKICRTCAPANDIESSLPEDNEWGWNINVFVIHNLSTLLLVVISWACHTQSKRYYEVWNSFIILGTIKYLKIFVSNIIIRKCECIVNVIEQNENGGEGGSIRHLHCVSSTDILHCDCHWNIALWLVLIYCIVINGNIVLSHQKCTYAFLNSESSQIVYLFGFYSS